MTIPKANELPPIVDFDKITTEELWEAVYE